MIEKIEKNERLRHIEQLILRSILKNEKCFNFLKSNLKFYYDIDIDVEELEQNENLLSEIIDTLDDTDVLSDLEKMYVNSIYDNKLDIKYYTYYFRKIRTSNGYLNYSDVYCFVKGNFMGTDIFKKYNYIEFVNEFLYNMESIINSSINLGKEITSGDIFSFLYIMFKILDVNSKFEFYKYVNYCFVPTSTNNILGIRVLKYITDYVDNKEQVEQIFNEWYFGFDIIVNDDIKKFLSRYVVEDLDIGTRKIIVNRIDDILSQNNSIIVSDNEIIIDSDTLETIF